MVGCRGRLKRGKERSGLENLVYSGRLRFDDMWSLGGCGFEAHFSEELVDDGLKVFGVKPCPHVSGF